MEIKLNDITHKNILSKVDASLISGKINFVIGKNGSGKTTLLKILSGLLPCDFGEIYINNIINEPLTLLNKSVYVAEDVIDSFSNIKVESELKSFTNKYNIEKAKKYIDAFVLDQSIMEKNVLELSFSEMKKISIISALLSDRKILLFDNPTAGLDYKSVQNFIKILKSEKRKNKIIIISTNNIEFMTQLSESIGQVLLISKLKSQVYSKDDILSNDKILKDNNLKCAKVTELINYINENKNYVKLKNTNNINDFIKDVYRNV